MVIAHGAGPSWNAPVESAVARTSRSMPAAVGYLMGDGRTPQQAYDTLVRQGVSRIVVVPLLVSSHRAHAEQIRFLAGLRPDCPPRGPHVPGAAARLRSRANRDPRPGRRPAVAAILADRARALSRAPGAETLLLVAHGPNEDEDAARWTATMRALAREIGARMPFREIDTCLLRDDAPKPVKERALAELRAAAEAHAAAGRVIVVPLLLSPGGWPTRWPTDRHRVEEPPRRCTDPMPLAASSISRATRSPRWKVAGRVGDHGAADGAAHLGGLTRRSTFFLSGDVIRGTRST